MSVLLTSVGDSRVATSFWARPTADRARDAEYRPVRSRTYLMFDTAHDKVMMFGGDLQSGCGGLF
jgi:hypothetical protein